MRTILTSQLLICILLLPGLVKAQSIIITGKVISSDGEALKNVSIFETNKKIGTISNQKGFFKLILSEGELNLKVSENGYSDVTQNFVLAGDTTINVQLVPENRNRQRKLPNYQANTKSAKKYLAEKQIK